MRNYVIALYIRLSVEDFKTESLSIPNQKLILREKAMSLPEWDNSEILEFIDNGHTGTNFERPAVQELLTMVQAGKINCIIVKDLSRFGRNSIESTKGHDHLLTRGLLLSHCFCGFGSVPLLLIMALPPVESTFPATPEPQVVLRLPCDEV